MSTVRVITITVDDLRAVVREEVEAAVQRTAPPTPPRDLYISLAEAHRRTGRHPDTLRRWIRQGRLKAKQGRPGEAYRVRPEDLEAALDRATTAEPVDVDAAADLILSRRR